MNQKKEKIKNMIIMKNKEIVTITVIEFDPNTLWNILKLWIDSIEGVI